MRTFLTLFAALIVVATMAQKKPKINQAKTALADKDYATAKSIVDQAIEHEKTKEDPVAWFVRGQVYAALDTANSEPGALETSIAAFDKALELDPEEKKISSFDINTGAMVDVAFKKQGYYTYYYNKAIVSYNAGEYQSAADNFETAFYIMPSDTNAVLNAAYAAGAADNTEQAKKNYIGALDAGIVNKNIYLQLYNYATKAENYEEALAVIQRGREALPTDIDLMKFEVNLFIQLGQKDEAKAKLEKAIAADPESADLQFTLGVLLDESGDLEGAKGAYSKALQIDPDHFNSNFNLGVLAYNKVSELVKEQGNLNYYPGQSRPNQAEKKKYEELNTQIDVELENSLPIWEKLYSLNNTDENVLQTLGYIYKALGKKAEHAKIEGELKALQGG